VSGKGEGFEGGVGGVGGGGGGGRVPRVRSTWIGGSETQRAVYAVQYKTEKPGGPSWWLRFCDKPHVKTNKCAYPHFSLLGSGLFDINIIINATHAHPGTLVRRTEYRRANLASVRPARS